MVLLDIEKTCATLWLNGLFFKIISLNVPDYLLSFLKSYSEGLAFSVHLNDSISSPKPTPSGLPQDAALSTLFSFYLPDVPRPPHTHLASYADDTPLLSQSWRPDSVPHRLESRCNFTAWKHSD